MKTKKVFIGKFNLGNKVDITDPGYDNNDFWYSVECIPGEYYAYITYKDCGAFGKRVSKLSIYKDNKNRSIRCTNNVALCGVDSGLCGFFNNKPNYSDKEWDEICNELSKTNYDYIVFDYGVASSTGFGDGEYIAYSNKDKNVFEIRFM